MTICSELSVKLDREDEALKSGRQRRISAVHRWSLQGMDLKAGGGLSNITLTCRRLQDHHHRVPYHRAVALADPS